MKKTLLTIGLVVASTALLTACDPPIPAEMQAVEAEKKHVCIDGQVTTTTVPGLQKIIEGWGSDLSAACANTSVTVTGKADTPRTTISTSTQDLNCTDGYTFPFAVDSGVVAYKVDDVTTLQLSPATLSKIISGQISDWSDPAIAKDNPDTEFSALPITVIKEANKNAANALSLWLGSLKSPLDLAPLTLGDKPAPAPNANGSIVITTRSTASQASLNMLNIIVGTKDGDPQIATPDDVGVYEGASQWVVSETTKAISVKPDFSAPATPPQGFDLAPAYGGTFAVTGTICPEKQELTQSVAYYWLRTDSQNTLQGSPYSVLASKVRAKIFVALGKGLPAAK
jgi:hypothetical protein